MSLVHAVVAYLAGLTYVWSLVDERHKNKMKKHEAEAPKSPISESPTALVDKKHEETAVDKDNK